jgi:hypothetical protein
MHPCCWFANPKADADRVESENGESEMATKKPPQCGGFLVGLAGSAGPKRDQPPWRLLVWM